MIYMHSGSSGDPFLLWLSTIPKHDNKRISWQQAFARRLKFDPALLRDWKTLTTAGCNPDVLNALLWEISTPAGLDIIDRHRDRVKDAEKERAAIHKALNSLNVTIKRTSAELVKHLGLLNLLYEGLLEQRKQQLLFARTVSRVEASLPNSAQSGESGTANDCMILGDPAYLAAQLCAWSESLSNLLSETQFPKRKLTDARRFFPLLKYVSQFFSPIPYAPLARLIKAALKSARHDEAVTADQLRLIWNRNR